MVDGLAAGDIDLSIYNDVTGYDGNDVLGGDIDITLTAAGWGEAGMFTGAMIGPALFGLIADHHGFGWAWMLSCGCSASAMVLVAGGATLHRRADQPVS